jgi:hypothetical protein
MKARGKELMAEPGELAVKAVSFHVMPMLMLAGQLGVLWLSTKVSLFPGSDRFLSIVSTCAEIIAGLYGITLASYTFFLSRIDGLTASDGTLDYVVGSIKNRYKYLIWYITSNVLMTLLISIVLMYAPVPTGDELGFFYRLFCNEFVLFVVFSAALILYYSVGVVDPNSIEKEARRLKKKLGGYFGVPGDAVAFIMLYDRIEARCDALIPQAVLRQLQQNKGKHFELTLALLEEQKLLKTPMLQNVRRIHRYYECVVNCAPMRVSQEMCQLAEKTLKELEK